MGLNMWALSCLSNLSSFSLVSRTKHDPPQHVSGGPPFEGRTKNDWKPLDSVIGLIGGDEQGGPNAAGLEHSLSRRQLPQGAAAFADDQAPVREPDHRCRLPQDPCGTPLPAARGDRH